MAPFYAIHAKHKHTLCQQDLGLLSVVPHGKYNMLNNAGVYGVHVRSRKVLSKDFSLISSRLVY